MGNRNREWTEEEETILRECWNILPSEQIAEKLNRSIHSVNVRANRIGLAKKSMTLNQYSKILGYEVNTIKRVAEKLNLTFENAPRRSRKNPFMRKPWSIITEEQMATIIEFLEKNNMPKYVDFRKNSILKDGIIISKLGKWGAIFERPEGCLVCGTNKIPHYAKGMCSPCYRKLRAKTKKKRRKIENERRNKGNEGTKVERKERR